MPFPLLVFIVSGIALLAIIALKLAQERFEVLLFWPDARNIVEKKLRIKLAGFGDIAARACRENFYVAVRFVLLRLRRLVDWFGAKIDKRLQHLLNLIRGRRTIETHAPASRFLHDITSFRDRIREEH